MPVSSVQRYIRVSAASTAAWLSSANSTKASVERKSDSQTVRPERFASSIRGQCSYAHVWSCRVPRRRTSGGGRRSSTGLALELSDCGARILDEPLGQVPLSGAELDEAEMREALGHPPLLTTHPVPLGFDGVPIARGVEVVDRVEVDERDDARSPPARPGPRALPTARRAWRAPPEQEPRPSTSRTPRRRPPQAPARSSRPRGLAPRARSPSGA